MTDPQRRFGDIELTFDHTADDVVSAARTMLAFGISKLSPDEREARLVDIEAWLRHAARRFELCQPSPYPRATDGRIAH